MKKHVKNVQNEGLALSIYADDAFTWTLMITFPSLPSFFLLFQDMGPTSMPSVPLMVGCGVSCTALLILLLIYAAFWRYEPTWHFFPPRPYSFLHTPFAKSIPLTLSTSKPPLSRKMQFMCVLSSAKTTTSNKCFKYSRRWWLDSACAHDRWHDHADHFVNVWKDVFFSPTP